LAWFTPMLGQAKKFCAAGSSMSPRCWIVFGFPQ
jgi:hypothetical protein